MPRTARLLARVTVEMVHEQGPRPDYAHITVQHVPDRESHNKDLPQ
jgi:hypothetical protein